MRDDYTTKGRKLLLHLFLSRQQINLYQIHKGGFQ
jgi:hypothetical protein